MADIAPVSALAGHVAPGLHGPVGEGGAGIRLSERRLGSLWQVGAWPGRVEAVGAALAAHVGADAAPGPLRSASGAGGVLMRTEPLKWLLASDGALARPEVGAEDGTVLDLSHARTAIRVEGPAARDLMARMVPLDLRAGSFADGQLAATGIHHVGCLILRRGEGFEVWTPRSFGLAIWEHMLESAAQFGVEAA